MRGVWQVPVRGLREAAAAAVALAGRLPVQHGDCDRLYVVHVLREGALLPLLQRGGGRLGRGAVRGRAVCVFRQPAWHALGLSGCAVHRAAVPVVLLAAAWGGRRVRGCVRAHKELRLSLQIAGPGQATPGSGPALLTVFGDLEIVKDGIPPARSVSFSLDSVEVSEL